MDTETYEQTPLNENELSDAFKFVKENEMVKVLSYKGKVFGVEAPNFVVLEIVETEPGMPIKKAAISIFMGMQNVILTGHFAFYTDQAIDDQIRIVLESLKEFVEKGTSANQIV